MTERVLGPTGSPRRRWTMLVPLTLAVLFGLVFIAGAQAVHDEGLVELDKNATDDLTTSKLGILQANISDSASPIVVCESATAPATNFTILVEAEEMTVTARAAIAGGSGGCSTKASYSVTRGSNNVAHQKADDVTLLVQVQDKPGTDWDEVHEQITLDPNDTGNDDKCTALGLVECSYVNDGVGVSIFDGGSSKDHLPIAGWQHKAGSVSDKSEILNAYAAKGIGAGNHQILYFGADRQAVDGSTDAGFWFFRNEVVANPDGSFTGVHSGTLASPGDILILTTFTQGGATNNVRVFRWVGSGGNESGTIQGPDGTFPDCVPGGSGAQDNGCATVNDTSITVPWDYTAKNEPVSGWIPAGGALEGAVDLTALGLEGCFSSFLAETRASPSVPSILEDFSLGKFEACGASVVTTPKTGAGGALTADSDNDNLDEISIGTGSVQVKDSALLNVTGISSFDGTIAFHLCGPLGITAPLPSCATGGVAISSHDADANGTYVSDAATLTSVGRYCWRADFTSTTNGVPDASDSTVESAGPPKSTGECFEVMPVTPSLDTDAGDGPVDFGQAVTDTAALSGTANKPGSAGPNATYPTINPTVAGAVAGGTITFRLYGPAATSTPTTTECDTLAAGFATENPNGIQRAVSGNGTYPKVPPQAVVSFTPTAPGFYFWKASYDGDSPNTSASGEHNTTCTDGDEAVQVRQVPTGITTRQFIYPQDKATVTATAGGNLGGSVTFKLYDSSANCTANEATGLLLTDGPHAIAGASPQSATTNNTSARVTTNTTVYWRVTYTSTNTAHLGSSSVCVESTTVSFAGNDGTITIP